MHAEPMKVIQNSESSHKLSHTLLSSSLV